MYFLYLTWLSKNHTIDLCPCPAIFGILSCRLLNRVSAFHLRSLMSFLFFLTTDIFFSSGAVCADDRRLKVYYTENTKILGKNVNIQREVWLCLSHFKIETVETYYRFLLMMASIRATLFQVRKFYVIFGFLTLDLDDTLRTWIISPSESLEFLLYLNIH